MREISFAVQCLLGVLALSVHADAQSGKGMTWKMIGTNTPTGTLKIGCANSCDAYKGDTACTTALPILCIKKSGAGFPLPPPPSVDNSSRYHRWTGGIVGTTAATVLPATLTAANALCAQTFGAWRCFTTAGAGTSRATAASAIQPSASGSTSMISLERPAGTSGPLQRPGDAANES